MLNQRDPKFALILLVVFSLVGMAGCSRSDGRKSVTIHGQVTLNDAPLDTGSIHFVSVKTGETAYANIDTNGQYRLEFQEAIPGETYQVMVQPDEVLNLTLAERMERKRSTTKIPEKYRTPMKSGLSVQIGSDPDLEFSVDLK